METVIKDAMVICVGHKDWNLPKHVLIETSGRGFGNRLDEVANKAFEKYKESQNDDELWLVSYTYFGDVEIFEEIK